MSEKKVQATVQRKREVRTFAELSHANFVLLENTEKQRPGWFYECMTSILMAAFKFEAYLNHIGATIFSYWNDMERLPHKKKLSIIRSYLGIEKKDGERPYQTLTDLFRFRDDIAHGKTVYLGPSESVETGYVEELRSKELQTGWESLCTIEFAKRAYEDTAAIIEQIHSAAGQGVEGLYRSGHSYTIKDVQELES